MDVNYNLTGWQRQRTVRLVLICISYFLYPLSLPIARPITRLQNDLYCAEKTKRFLIVRPVWILAHPRKESGHPGASAKAVL